MSNSVFSPCDGAIVRIPMDCKDSSATAAKITVGNLDFGFPITGFSLELEGNYQFLHTVNKFIYAYVFGDRVGLLTLSGMAFLGPTCGPSFSDASLCSVFTRYKEKRLAKGSAVPINLLGCMAMVGFLTGMRIEISRPEVPVVQFLMRFHVILQDE